jgi:hypothetical protein
VKATLLVCVALLLAATAQIASSAAPAYDRQVVALSVTYQPFDEYRPWSKGSPKTRAGSAIVLEGGRILTELQIIRDAVLIMVEKNANSRRVAARVVHIDAELDLALLEIDDPGFFDDLQPVRFATSAPAKGLVRSVRWSDQQFEISESHVVRVEVRESPYGSAVHAFVLMSTDMKDGGWSEPVFSNGRVIGLTVMQEGQHAVAIPSEILRSYLHAVDSGLSGLPFFRPYWQFGRDPSLAAFLGLTGPLRGVVLRWVPWGSSGCDRLEPRDVLLRLGGHEIDSIGNYEHDRYGQINFMHITADGYEPGDKISARVLRKGRIVDLDFELRRYPNSSRLIPKRRDERPLPYLVAGGLVFREFDANYLRAWGAEWRSSAPSNLVQRYLREREAQTRERRRILLVSHVLPDAYNLGYHELANLALKQINGREVQTVRDAEEAFRHPVAGFHRLEFYRDDTLSEVILDAASFEEASARILENYDIPERIRVSAPSTAKPPGCDPQD